MQTVHATIADNNNGILAVITRSWFAHADSEFAHQVTDSKIRLIDGEVWTVVNGELFLKVDEGVYTKEQLRNWIIEAYEDVATVEVIITYTCKPVSFVTLPDEETEA